MRDSVARAEAAGATNAQAVAGLSSQMAELRAAQLDWQQNVLSGRLAALRSDSERISANDRLKVCLVISRVTGMITPAVEPALRAHQRR